MKTKTTQEYTSITVEFEELMSKIAPDFCEQVFGTEDIDIYPEDVSVKDGGLIIRIWHKNINRK